MLNNLREMARQGASVDVIAPASWVQSLRTWRNKPAPLDYGDLAVSRPTVTTAPLSFSNRLRPRLTRLNDNAMQRAVEHTMRALPPYHDFCYAHFFPSARAAAAPMAKRGIPLFLNLGESDPWDYESVYGRDRWIRELAGYAGIVTVSLRNMRYVLDRDPALEAKMRHLPNGVDTARYRPLPRGECRAKLSLPEHAVIAVFCGYFDDRKGPLRVLQAIEKIGIHGVFLGSGADRPAGSAVLFTGAVPAADMPLWLNAANVFVLPTLSEGMSNAILEALACGLPLVVSDRDFNREFLTDDCCVFVDPVDPESIASGILTALESGNAARMSRQAIALAKRYSIENRIGALFEFVEEVIGR